MDTEEFGDSNGDLLYDSQSEPQSMDAMSDMVQSMAASIYSEFEKLIRCYGDSAVESLMPQLVAILENWDRTIKEKQKIQLELDLTKEDNDQLLDQYDREKQLRKLADQRNLEVEDAVAEQQKELQARLDQTQKTYKILEMKSKNYQDQVSRLEEKDTQLKAEYDKLHDRYTELFKSHMEIMEKTKALMGPGISEGEGALNDIPRSSLRPSKTMGPNFVAPPTPDTETRPLSVSGEDPIPAPSTPARDTVIRSGSLHSEIVTNVSRDGTGHNLQLSLEAAAFDELEPESDDMTGSMVHPGDFASVSDDFFGMTKEVENLIKENQELIQTKNALNVVKDDLINQVDELTGNLELLRGELHHAKNEKEALEQRIASVEEELKQMRTKLAADDEENVPRDQRKRFTRVEMARILMERNQYKEKLMELQEAVRWTEMIRATKENIAIPKKRSSLWNLFNNLFSSNFKTKKLPSASLHYSSPSTNLQPVGDPNRPRRSHELPTDMAKAYDFLQEDALTEQGRKQKEADRREKYRQVQAHVAKDDGRVQAYGWSVPTKSVDQRTTTGVPVPVYCRPLVSAEDQRTLLWCAAAVHRTFGRTREGDSIVGAYSVFYSDSESLVGEDSESILSQSPHLSELNQQLTEHQRTVSDLMDTHNLTSLVWICTTSGTASRIQVINASNPAEVLESFDIQEVHVITIASIPGARSNDYPRGDSSDLIQTGEVTAEGDLDSEKVNVQHVDSSTSLSSGEKYESLSDKLSPSISDEDSSPAISIDEGRRKLILPTMWLGTQNGHLLIYSSLDDWKVPIKCIELGHCVLCIVHAQGKVFVGLANGTIAIFHRSADGSWCFTDFHVMDFGEEKVPIRCMCAVANTSIWIGHKNKIYTVDAKTVALRRAFDAHPRKESQVRLITWSGDGVWVSLRNETTLRLYHAFTLEHLQDIDIEPCVEKLIGQGKPDLTHISALELSCNRLWVGTGNGIIISLPLCVEETSDNGRAAGDVLGIVKPPGGAVRVYSDQSSEKVLPASFIPYCDLAQAQLSFHGHRDCVRFFATIAGSSKETSLVMSGGEGYVDFRVGDDSVTTPEEPSENSPTLWSHLIVWEVSNQA